jgi:hypothetical protein
MRSRDLSRRGVGAVLAACMALGLMAPGALGAHTKAGRQHRGTPAATRTTAGSTRTTRAATTTTTTTTATTTTPAATGTTPSSPSSGCVVSSAGLVCVGNPSCAVTSAGVTCASKCVVTSAGLTCPHGTPQPNPPVRPPLPHRVPKKHSPRPHHVPKKQHQPVHHGGSPPVSVPVNTVRLQHLPFTGLSVSLLLVLGWATLTAGLLLRCLTHARRPQRERL